MQYLKFKKKLKKLKERCGLEIYERMLFDIAMSSSMARASWIGNPVNDMIRFVNPQYAQISKHWFGGYPRVIDEILLNSYLKFEGNMKEMEDDPENRLDEF